MASNYPSDFDTFPTINALDKANSGGALTHREFHNLTGDSIEALEATLGINPQGGYVTVSERLASMETSLLALLSGDVTAASVGVLSNVGAIDSTVYEATVSSASAGLDITTYGVFDITLSNDAVLFVSDNPTSGKDVEWKVYIRGAFMPTFHNVIWAGGSVPTHDDVLSVYVFSTVDGGTTILGHQAGTSYA